MKLKKYIVKNQLKDFPQNILKEIDRECIKQGNKNGIKVMDEVIFLNKSEGGFTWSETNAGYNFWESIIIKKEFNYFKYYK